MSKEAETEKLVAFAIKVNNATKERFTELKEDGAFDTAGQFLETLLERYSNPLKINKQNEEQIKALREKEAKLTSELTTVNGNCNAQVEEIERLKNVNVQQAKLIEELTHNVDNLKQNIKQTEGHILVPVTPLQQKCLEYMAERECRHYNRKDITPEKFFMYAVQKMLIEGNKFSVDSVPDSVIAKFEKQLKDGE